MGVAAGLLDFRRGHPVVARPVDDRLGADAHQNRVAGRGLAQQLEQHGSGDDEAYLVPQDASEEQQITAVVLRDDAPMPEAA